MNTHTLQLTRQERGPILAGLVKPSPAGELIERKHGTFLLTNDQAGRMLLFEKRSIPGGRVYDYAWDKVLTVERDTLTTYLVTLHATNERQVRTARFARQIVIDILDHEEREFIERLHGF